MLATDLLALWLLAAAVEHFYQLTLIVVGVEDLKYSFVDLTPDSVLALVLLLVA